MGNSPSESSDYPDGVSVDVDVDPHQDRIRDPSSVAATSQQTFYRVEATVEKQVQQTAVASSSKTFQQSTPEPRVESVEKQIEQECKDGVESEEQVVAARQTDAAFQLKVVNDSTPQDGLESKKTNLQSMEDGAASWPQSVSTQRDKPCTDKGAMPSPTTVTSRADGIVSDEQCDNERGRVKVEQRTRQRVEISEAGAPQSHDPSIDDTKMSHDTSTEEERGGAPSFSRGTDKCEDQYHNTSESTQQTISSLKSVERELETKDKERDTEPAADITGNEETGSTLLGDSPSESVTTYCEGSQSHPHQPSTDYALSQPSSTSFTSVRVSGELMSASLKETGHKGKEHEATFSGTTKEAAPPTESVEKQLETENTGTSQESLSEASQSLPHEPSSDDTKDKLLTTSVGVGEEEKSVQSSSKEISHDGKGHEAGFSGTTKEAAPPTESVEKKPKTINIATRQESLSGASQSLPREPSSDDTHGKWLTTSVGVGEEERSVQSSSKDISNDGNGRTVTSCSTTQQTVTFVESDKKQIITDIETKPSAMRLTDMEAVSPLIWDDPLQTAGDNGETTHTQPDKPSADSTKPSPSTGTSTGGVIEEQDIEGSGINSYNVISV